MSTKDFVIRIAGPLARRFLAVMFLATASLGITLLVPSHAGAAPTITCLTQPGPLMGGCPAGSPPIVGIAAVFDDSPNVAVTSSGTVYDPFGMGPGLNGHALAAPIVGIAAPPLFPVQQDGYWLAARDGGVFAFDGVSFLGSMVGQHLNAPIVGIASLDAGGYWLVASDGGVFSFGNAPFFGSMGGQHLNAPIVGMTVSPDDGGYWLVASDGGVFSFGDATFFGSMAGRPLSAPVIGMVGTAGSPGTSGYYLAAADGGIFAFGNAVFYGSAVGDLDSPVVGIAGETNALAEMPPTQTVPCLATASGEVVQFVQPTPQ
jgi:hypothetical protein